MILERATGMTVTAYLQQTLWDPLGMEFGGSWSLDSRASGFEKMESGLNARAIDFAKFGRLFARGGEWDGEQVLPAQWVAASTEPDLSKAYGDYYPPAGVFAERSLYYKYFWWGLHRPDGNDFAAWGNHGQFIYVSPVSGVIIVRIGQRYGQPGAEWLQTFSRVAALLGQQALP